MKRCRAISAAVPVGNGRVILGPADRRSLREATRRFHDGPNFLFVDHPESRRTVILETNQQEQLMFKHAIATVVVSKPFHGPMHTSAASAASHSVPWVPVGNGDN